MGSFSDTDASSYVTNSVTPTAGLAYLLWVYATRASSADPPDATVTGQSLTWTSLASLLWATDAPTHPKVQLLQGAGTPAAGALTIDFGGVTQTSAVWNELTAS